MPTESLESKTRLHIVPGVGLKAGLTSLCRPKKESPFLSDRDWRGSLHFGVFSLCSFFMRAEMRCPGAECGGGGIFPKEGIRPHHPPIPPPRLSNPTAAPGSNANPKPNPHLPPAGPACIFEWGKIGKMEGQGRKIQISCCGEPHSTGNHVTIARCTEKKCRSVDRAGRVGLSGLMNLACPFAFSGRRMRQANGPHVEHPSILHHPARGVSRVGLGRADCASRKQTSRVGSALLG